jgi:hypothetical protein
VSLTTLLGDVARPEVDGILPAGEAGGRVVVDLDGRFRVEGIVPGLRYRASAVRGFMGLGTLFKDVTVALGEVKDLGDLKIEPFKP